MGDRHAYGQRDQEKPKKKPMSRIAAMDMKEAC